MSETSIPVWERRFRAPIVSLPTWSRHAPERMTFLSNESGSYQAYAWIPAAGVRRRVTDDPVGVDTAMPTADGSGIVWFHDETGDEHGHWMVEPLEGGEARPLVPDVPDGWPSGLVLGRSVVALALADRDGRFTVYASVDGGPARMLFRHEELVEVGAAERGGFDLGGLSADESLVLISHAEHGDPLHPALRVLDPGTGAVRGDLWDGAGFGLRPAAWSPLEGDHRVAVVHEREELERPAIWDLGSGERRDVSLDLPGAVLPLDWWPDASALLLLHAFEGRDRLLRYELDPPAVREIEHPPGTIVDARVRPDGGIWYRVSSSSTRARVLDERGRVVLAAEGERAPEGRPFSSWHFANPGGQRVHGFYVTPPGEGPFPLIVEVHGGPHWLWEDRFAPSVQAAVDHGYALAMVNYRGSTGYSRGWRDAIIGNPGLTELEDVVAGLDDLVARGVADPERLVLAGASWGGYITLLGVGLHPERWAAAIAEVPVADYVAAYEDEAPSLQAMDRGLFGGGPSELPEMYRERSPITYVDRVKAPLLILAGENDSRCPIRQIDNYLAAMRARGMEPEVYRYDTGHSSYVTDEQVRQMRVKLDFLLARVPPGPRSG